MYNTGEGAAIYPGSNLAIYKVYKHQGVHIASVTGSSVFYSNPMYVPQHAIDGDTMTFFHSDSLDMEPWLSLVLREPVMVNTVRIYPDFTHSKRLVRFKNVEIRVGMNPPVGADATMNPFFAFYAGPYDNSSW
ncbi:uncharacterized protein LOC122266791 [Penaeus japonicus]|uniref:uncharacterized protein LOC122266791 n=1 Tax=Penaeus japonicus TaxID=27405 RepID=UPI001C70F54B|nr:uncharacterized protein LOC122266791 [Penaeus japonicus]